MAEPQGRQVISKIIISVFFGGIGYALSTVIVDNTDSQIAVGLAVSLFVAGVAFVVQFLQEVEKRLEEVSNAYSELAASIQSRVAEGFTKINEATELFSLVEASALKTDAMTQLVRNSTQIDQEPKLVFDFVQAEIDGLSRALKSFSDGSDVTYEGEDRDWLLGLTNVASKSIDATSLTTVDAGGRGFTDGGLWSSDLGYRYLDAQREAIVKRNVVIRRIFIMDRPGLLNDPEFLAICRRHMEVGILVRVFDPSQPSGPPPQSLFDFVIFDGVLSYQTTPASRISDKERPAIVDTRLVTRSMAVIDRIYRFQDLWRASLDVPMEKTVTVAKADL